MDTRNLVNRRVSLLLSDPWDLVGDCGPGPFRARVKDLAENNVLIEFEQSLQCNNTRYSRARCQVRHEGSALRDLLVGSVLSVNIIILKSGVPRLADLSDADYKDNLTAVGTLQVI
jgi:hypothetical protein